MSKDQIKWTYKFLSKSTILSHITDLPALPTYLYNDLERFLMNYIDYYRTPIKYLILTTEELLDLVANNARLSENRNLYEELNAEIHKKPVKYQSVESLFDLYHESDEIKPFNPQRGYSHDIPEYGRQQEQQGGARKRKSKKNKRRSRKSN